MAHSEVLLLQPVDGLGNEGEQVRVKAGYARNYLLPKGVAIPLTRANKKQVEALEKRRTERLAKELEGATKIKEQIEATNIAIAMKTGPGGRLFGAVTAQMLFDRLVEEQVPVERKVVSLPQPIKELGKHSTTIKLHPEVEATLTFEVVSENPIEAAEGEEDEAAEPATSES